LIIDNALISYERLQAIRQEWLKRPFFDLKVDMMKAYDRQQWLKLTGRLTTNHNRNESRHQGSQILLMQNLRTKI
jgi:hypothetical protein